MLSVANLPGERKCAQVIFRMIFQTNTCPKCDGSLHQTRAYFWCKVCRVKWRPKAVTWLNGCKLNNRQLLALVICWIRNVTPGDVLTTLGISYTTTARWYSRFRQHLPR